jgi:hypothetical protein
VSAGAREARALRAGDALVGAKGSALGLERLLHRPVGADPVGAWVEQVEVGPGADQRRGLGWRGERVFLCDLCHGHGGGEEALHRRGRQVVRGAGGDTLVPDHAHAQAAGLRLLDQFDLAAADGHLELVAVADADVGMVDAEPLEDLEGVFGHAREVVEPAPGRARKRHVAVPPTVSSSNFTVGMPTPTGTV